MLGSAVAQQYQEVVYLKNGSIIRGVITEMIPDTSLKIRLADGSILVYLMSDVVKIAKESPTLMPKYCAQNNQLDKVYHRLYASYSPITIKDNLGGKVDMTGLSLGWTMGLRMIDSHPLYLETGAGFSYWFSDESYLGVREEDMLFSLNIPIVFTWQFEVVPKVYIAPYLGLNVRGNLIGRTRVTYDKQGELLDWFKSDEGDGNRINVGLNFGAHFTFNKGVIGLGYTTDFTKIMDALNKVHYFTVSAGYRF